MGESMINPPAMGWFRADQKEPAGTHNRILAVLGRLIDGRG